MKINIRKAVADDAENIAELLLISGGDFFKLLFGENAKNSIISMVSLPDNLLSYDKTIIADMNNEVVGMVQGYNFIDIQKDSENNNILLKKLFQERLNWIILLSGFMPQNYGYPLKNEFYISAVAVYKNFQHKGIAKSLLQYTLKNNVKLDISLDIDSDNKTAFNLYRKLGFKIKSKHKQFFRSKIYRMNYDRKI